MRQGTHWPGFTLVRSPLMLQKAHVAETLSRNEFKRRGFAKLDAEIVVPGQVVDHALTGVSTEFSTS